MNQIQLRKFLSQLLPVIVTFSVVNIPSDSSGFSLIPSMKICIQQKFGNSALISITKAKKLNSIQNNQLKICQKITTQPSGSAGSPPSIGSPCNNLGEKLDVNGKPIECIKNASGKLEWGPPMREQGGQQNPPQNSSANSGGTSKSGMPPWVLQDNSPLYGLQFGLLATMLSNQSGLGNIANPSLIEFPDKSLRLFFRSGSDMSVPIKIDNPGTHSYLSTDGGKTWTLEDGFRIKSDAIVSVRKAEGSGFEAYGFKGIDNELVKYTSSDGKNFTEASTSLVDASQCKNRRGVTVSFLGNDPQVVKTSSGYIGYVKSNSLINQPPWTKVACKLVSSDGINWSVDPTGTIELDDGGVVSNIGLYRNGAGNLQLLLHAYGETAGKAPVSRFEIRTSSDEGKTWKNPIDYGIQFGDPEIDELSTGETLLVGGNFDPRRGGMIMVMKKYSSNIKASRFDNADSAGWKITGATKDQVKIKNLCLNTDETSNAIFETNGSVLNVYLKDQNPVSDPTLRGVYCAYALIGPQQLIR